MNYEKMRNTIEENQDAKNPDFITNIEMDSALQASNDKESDEIYENNLSEQSKQRLQQAIQDLKREYASINALTDEIYDVQAYRQLTDEAKHRIEKNEEKMSAIKAAMEELTKELNT